VQPDGIHGENPHKLATFGASAGPDLLCGAGRIRLGAWMIASGAGMYVVYTPFNAMLFDRLVAVSGRVANAGFLIYVADSAGYAGSCALLLWRNFGLTQKHWLTVFRYAVYATAITGVILVSLSLLYFNSRARAAASIRVVQGT
jgi:hypothetical protein